MRFTAKNKDGRYGFLTDHNTLGIFDKDSLADKCYTKLGQLEDIEENELGIDLITLFNALKNGIWIKKTNGFGEVFYDKEKVASFSFYFKEIYVEHECEYQYSYALKDYGKTWALTKEELL